MFYSQFILAKKGPLGTIWIAAHLERKLRKNQVADTDIGDSVDSILSPDVPIALRLSSHLLLGVVRIYSRKVNYLFDDCSEALLKIKQAFRSTAVDLPPEESTAPYHSITLPETFDLDDFELPDNDIFQGNYVDHHVSAREQITLQDTITGVYPASQFGLDERFGDGDTSQVGFDLEEDLLLGKVDDSRFADASESDPQASTEPVVCMETDLDHDEMAASSLGMPVNGTRNKNEDLTAITELIEHTQAPSTPVLVGETNLSSVEKGVLCDDNVESEYQNAAELVGIGVKNASSIHQHKNDVADLLTSTRLDHDTDICMVHGENGDQGNLQSTEIMGSVSANRIDDRLNGLAKVECINNNSEPTEDHIHGECVDSKKGWLCQTDEAKDVNEIDQSHSQGEAVSPSKLPAALEYKNIELHRDPENPENLNEHVANELAVSNGVAVLRACSLQTTNPVVSLCDVDNPVVPFQLPSEDAMRLSSTFSREGSHAAGHSDMIQGEGYSATDYIQFENQEPESMYYGQLQANDDKLDEHLDKVISTADQPEKLDTSKSPELPGPEKLLSLPKGHFDKAGELLANSGPEKEITAEDYGSHSSYRFFGNEWTQWSLPASSLTTPALNSVELFGMNRSKITVDSIPGDDDLLSSILVGGKSSVLKVKPTPTPDEVSMKRGRPAYRSTPLKRKMPMDDSMVLHGDTIRQQLMSTEDIRRQRKKAPCTQIEVLLIQRQLLEEEVFHEPIHTGASAEITCLHNRTFDISRIKISDLESAPVELSKDKEFPSSPMSVQCTEVEVSTQLVFCRNDVAQFNQTSVQPENHQGTNQSLGSPATRELGSINVNIKKFDYETTDEALPCVTEMEIDGNVELASAANPYIVLRGGTSQAEPSCEDVSMLPSDSLAQSALSNQNAVADADAPVWMDTSTIQSDNVNPQPREMIVGRDLTDINKGVDDFEGVDNCVENTGKIETILRAERNLVESNIRGCGELGVDAQLTTEQTDAYHDNIASGSVGQVFVNDQGQDYSSSGELGAGNNNVDLDVRSLHDDKEQIPTYLCDEETRFDVSYSLGRDGDVKSASLPDGDYSLYDQESNIDAELTPFDYGPEDIGDFPFANDTEFLNVDDDDDYADEEDIDGMPRAEDTRLLENTGWSGRTRAVAKYLQTLFNDQVGGRGTEVLLVDNLLANKTRKEAARMFFETLLLKTKDFIHVEQAKPYDNINIKPTTRLMKSEFR